MPYKITDLIDKFILIEQSGYEMYMKMAADESAEHRIKTLARVFANEEKRHMETFEQLKDEISREADIEIDLWIYDRAVKFIYEFINGNKPVSNPDTRSMLEFCLEFEKENLALAMSIRGIFINKENGAESRIFAALDEIIKEEEKHTKNIEAFLR